MVTDQAFDTIEKAKVLLPAALSAVIVWMCVDAIGPINAREAWDTLVGFEIYKWCAALALAYLSFKAVAHYDWLVAQHLKLDLQYKDTIQMGWRSTAVAQLAGAGLLTGSFTRWAHLKAQKTIETPIKTAALMTSSVTATFFWGWAVTTALAVISASAFGIFPAAFGGAALFSLVLLVGVPTFLRSKLINTPGLAFGLKSTFFAFADTITAATIIFLFLPDSYDSFLTIYIIFLISLSIGMISALPGGVGAFEVTMLFLLPNAAPSELIPALIAFRIVYYVVPAVLAVVTLVLTKRFSNRAPSEFTQNFHLSNVVSKIPALSNDLSCQKQISLYQSSDGETTAAIASSKYTDFVFGEPAAARLDKAKSVVALRDFARLRGKHLCFYQCDAKFADVIKYSNMSAVKFSSEAIVKTDQFDLSSPEFAKLRRKLRRALKQGISINSNHYNMSDLRAINLDWTGLHGREHGFSTGRFSVKLIAKQRVYVAFQSSRPIAFVTFSTSDTSWTLDLIRHAQHCPDGTVYSLIAQAIHDAKLATIKNVSLGCVPLSPEVHSRSVTGRLARLVFNRSRVLQGLYQSKRVFSPNWHDRYIGFSSIKAIPIIAFSLFNQIHKPPQLEEN